MENRWRCNSSAHVQDGESQCYNAALKARNLIQETKADLMEQKQWIDDLIERHQQDQKRLQQDLTLKWKHLKDIKAALKKIQAKKMKMDIPTVAEMENILSDMVLLQPHTMAVSLMVWTAVR
jgi:hypothetical protein